tara:strand:- start:195 stop:404 length:210 start_codon:yes stop_codon:yes gene_type:complete
MLSGQYTNESSNDYNNIDSNFTPGIHHLLNEVRSLVMILLIYVIEDWHYWLIRTMLQKLQSLSFFVSLG